MAKLKIFNIEGKESGSLDLPDEIFAAPVNTRVMHQAVVMYNANRRQGGASTKDRKEVRGGGAKPWRQKGTGRSRHGSSRSPLWRGGGVTFGPKPRNFGYDVPKKVKKVALRESLNAKYQGETLTCLDDIKDSLSKTKEFVSIMDALKLDGSILALMDGCDESVARVSRNIASLDVKSVKDVNALDILRHKRLLASKTAVEELLKRLGK